MLPVFIISRDAARLARTMREVAELSPTHVPAIDGRDPSVRERSDVTPFARLFCPDKTLGCALSHRRTAVALLESGARAALVLEDDVIVKAPKRLAAELQTLVQAADAGAWDVIRLFCQGLCRRPLLGRWTLHGSCAAYLLSRSGAQKLVRRPVVWHVDVELNAPAFQVTVGPQLFDTHDPHGRWLLGQSLRFWLLQPCVRVPFLGRTCSVGGAAMAVAFLVVCVTWLTAYGQQSCQSQSRDLREARTFP